MEFNFASSFLLFLSIYAFFSAEIDLKFIFQVDNKKIVGWYEKQSLWLGNIEINIDIIQQGCEGF